MVVLGSEVLMLGLGVVTNVLCMCPGSLSKPVDAALVVALHGVRARHHSMSALAIGLAPGTPSALTNS